MEDINNISSSSSISKGKTEESAEEEERGESTMTTTEESSTEQQQEERLGELRALRSKVAAMRPLMRHISSYVFPGQCLGVLANGDRTFASRNPIAKAYRVQVQPSLVPSPNGERVGFESQENVTFKDQKDPMKIPQVGYDNDGNGRAYVLKAEQDNGLIVAVEGPEQRNPELSLRHDERLVAGADPNHRPGYKLRYGVGAGADGGDLAEPFACPSHPFFPFSVHGHHVYMAFANTMVWLNFADGVQRPDVTQVPRLNENDEEQYHGIFRNGQTLAANGIALRTDPNNNEIVLELFGFVDRFILEETGRPTRQGRFYLPRRPSVWMQFLRGPTTGDDDPQRLLVVTSDLHDFSSQIRLLPTNILRDEHQAAEAVQALPVLTTVWGATNFVVREDENGQEELLMSCFRPQGLLSLSLQDFNGAVEPRVLFRPENDDEFVCDFQLLDSVPWVVVWNKVASSNRLVKLGQDGVVLKSVPLNGSEMMRFL